MKRNYWGEDQEQAIIKYNASDSESERSLLYKTHLAKPLAKMCDSILRRYYHTYLASFDRADIENLSMDVQIHVVSNLYKYDPTKSKDSGSFGYFGNVVRFFLMDFFRKWTAERATRIDLDEIADTLEDPSYELNLFEDQDNRIEAIMELKRKLRVHSDPNVKKVIRAIIQLITEETDTNRYNKLYMALWLIRVTGFQETYLKKLLKQCEIKITVDNQSIQRAFRFYEQKGPQEKRDSDRIIKEWESNAFVLWNEGSRGHSINYYERKFRIENKKKKHHKNFR